MFKIGDFSRLSRVSVRTLRLYDQMGLLKPAQVDRFTGYRYYAAEQLALLNRIVAFKDLGFSLEQIAELLPEQIPSAQIRGMLRLKQAELQQLVEIEQARLARVAARLQQIEQEEAIGDYDVVLKPVEAQTVAAIRDLLPVCSDFRQLHNELWDALRQQQIEVVGLPQTLWHDAGYQTHNVDAEAIAPISPSLSTKSDLTRERIKTYTLPPVEQMACVVHFGSEETIIHAFNALLQWTSANHYQMIGVNREVYLNSTFLDKNCALSNGDLTNDSQLAIELQFPVQRCKL
ncbi:MAG TPA: MerR family transcriptional regulator [Coleofasciculaceae cyanobacterium]